MAPISLHAHNTLFGDAPRNMWRGGVEVEADAGWEIYRRFRHHDSNLSNPDDIRVQVWTYKFGFTYGLHRDIGVRVMLPVGYAVRTMKEREGDPSGHNHGGGAAHLERDTYFGMKDMSVGFKFRVYNEPHPGGSFQGGLFVDFMLPTAQSRGDFGLLSEKISFGDETFGARVGASWAYSTTRQYFWLDVSVAASTLNEGRVMGAMGTIHPAYALRVFELTDYRDFDMILLFEADLEFMERMWMDFKRVVPSGGYKVHVSFGIQMNITNRIELKMGYEYPVYTYYYMKTFVHDGEAKFSLNYLF